MKESVEFFRTPTFERGRTVNETPNYRVVMDYKPGFENQIDGFRFFIEPLTDSAEEMLIMAAETHGVPNLSPTSVDYRGEINYRMRLRADFTKENLYPLVAGQTKVPEEGKDTIPALTRMEECLRDHPNRYTFTD